MNAFQPFRPLPTWFQVARRALVAATVLGVYATVIATAGPGNGVLSPEVIAQARAPIVVAQAQPAALVATPQQVTLPQVTIKAKRQRAVQTAALDHQPTAAIACAGATAATVPTC